MAQTIARGNKTKHFPNYSANFKPIMWVLIDKLIVPQAAKPASSLWVKSAQLLVDKRPVWRRTTDETSKEWKAHDQIY